MDSNNFSSSGLLTEDENKSIIAHDTISLQLRHTYETVIAVLFLLLTIIIAVIGNTAVISVVCLQRSMRKDISNLLIINLSLTDLGNTLFVMLSALVALISDKWVFGKFWCDCVCAINYCLIIVSMLTLCCISIDRHQAIMHPLSYPLRITRRRLVLVICYTWIQGITFGIAPSIADWVAFDYWESICAIQWHSYRPDSIIYVVLAFLFCFLIPGMVLIYCYSKILKEVKNQKAQATLNPRGDSRTYEKNKRKVNDRSKLVWSLLVVVLAYFVCTTPFSVTKLIKVLADSKDPIPGPVNLVSALLGYVASAINPLIYGIFRRDFRCAYKNLLFSVFLRKKFHQTQTSDIPSHSGINTISRANQQTINQEDENNMERLAMTLKELKNTSDLIKNGSLKQCSKHILPTVREKTQTNGIGSGDFIDNPVISVSETSLEVPNGRTETRASVVSCQHVLVKSVNEQLE